MSVIVSLGIFWCIYGIVGLFGLQVIPERYKKKEWTKRYIRNHGLSWLKLGIPWLVPYRIALSRNINTLTTSILLIACSIPSLVYSIAGERKYKLLLKDNK